MPPPAVLINENGDILYISGRTGKYLEPAAGKANWNLFAMARSGLRQELGGAIRSALRQDERILLPGLNIDAETGPVRVDVTLEHHKETGPLHGLILIVFHDQPPLPLPLLPPPGARTRSRSVRLVELEEAIQRVRAQSRSANEEMQLSQEELRSTNEELQSTNEELQSANEELTTSKEEMQSMNEELQTLNAELQAKVDELSRASSDMKNLLDSTDIATLFLDRELRVRRFTPEATRIIRLIPTDIGRPITDLASPLDYPALATDADQVLRTLAPTEKPITSRDGRWFTVRIMAYRTLDDRIDGLVITFADITESKKLESRLRRGRKQGPAEPGADPGETSLESPPRTRVRKHPLRP